MLSGGMHKKPGFYFHLNWQDKITSFYPISTVEFYYFTIFLFKKKKLFLARTVYLCFPISLNFVCDFYIDNNASNLYKEGYCLTVCAFSERITFPVHSILIDSINSLLNEYKVHSVCNYLK